MAPKEMKDIQDKPAGAPDYGSWRSIAAGTLQGKKSFLDEGTPFQKTVDGLLGLMPVGGRSVTYLSEQAMTELGDSVKNGKEKDMSELPGVQTWSHGPYLDDWSKVPPEIAAKYNTSPSFKEEVKAGGK